MKNVQIGDTVDIELAQIEDVTISGSFIVRQIFSVGKDVRVQLKASSATVIMSLDSLKEFTK